MTSLESFNPLEERLSGANIPLLRSSLLREIDNILSSYTGRYDAFAELIQNSLDSVDLRKRTLRDATTYIPAVEVVVDIDTNRITVSDNGVGLSEGQYRSFLAPNCSFKAKNGMSRGHKGVGATFVAYGFDYMRISNKTPDFTATGIIRGARGWVELQDPSLEFPLVTADPSSMETDFFASQEQGLSITVEFGEHTTLKSLGWLQAKTAASWMTILSVKTAIGAVVPSSDVQIRLVVVYGGEAEEVIREGIGYFWLRSQGKKPRSLNEIMEAEEKSTAEYGRGRRLPGRFNNLDFLYNSWTAVELQDVLSKDILAQHEDVIAHYTPTIEMEYGYSAKLWSSYNEQLKVRSGQSVVKAGIQLAANGMPQGEVIQVPLTKNIGRQNQVHFLVHFDRYTPDYGRKGFKRELVDFSEDAAQYITQRLINRYHGYLKENTGAAPDLKRSTQLDQWKTEMVAHEKANPLEIESDHFFLPTKRISITSIPSREQDVIALFHELVSGGVIRGVQTLATNERSTYDGLYRATFSGDNALFEYDSVTNPLGISAELFEDMEGLVTEPKVLEYKYSLDGLISDINGLDKNLSDIDLCVVWETGDDYRDDYAISTHLLPENYENRQVHGFTHTLQVPDNRSWACDLIILKELVEFMTDRQKAEASQRQKYEEE